MRVPRRDVQPEEPALGSRRGRLKNNPVDKPGGDP